MPRAGGKVILCGEHAVVHGQDAIAVGLAEGVNATATPSDVFGLRINGRELAPSDPSVEALLQLYQAITKHNGARKVHVELEVTMPLGVGLGGSAAMAVAVARAIAELQCRELTLKELLAAAAAWERVFHGNPSGVDAAAAAVGGCLLFNRHTGVTPLPLGSALHLALAVAGPPSLTKTMVAQVADHQRRDPVQFGLTLGAIQRLVTEAAHCLQTSELERLGSLLSENHRHLCAWGLSTATIDEACSLALEAGALGAKLTGAGGGGCVLALCTESTLDAVVTAWRRKDFTTRQAIVPATTLVETESANHTNQP